jgi:hypothetical protein
LLYLGGKLGSQRQWHRERAIFQTFAVVYGQHLHVKIQILHPQFQALEQA